MLQTLELTNIRSYSSGLFEFSPSVNIIVGPNASGKTNLLEAVYMSATGNAFRSEDLHMIAEQAEWGRIDSQYENHNRSIKLQKTPLKKSFVLDGVDKVRLPEDKLLPVVLFEPSHLLLLASEPERRRVYIDNILTHSQPGYGALLSSYRRTLAQRNRLLKQDSVGPDHLFVWDVRLSDLAGKVVEHRVAHIKFLQDQLTQNYQAVSGNKDRLEVSYVSKSPPSQYANAMLQNLKKEFLLDRARGFSGSGPHRDDLGIKLNASDARNSASRGETRSIVIALKIAELKLIEQRTGKKPTLLLDDVFSELDGKRRRTISETFQAYQTFITTTDADVVIDHFSESCNIIPL